MELNLRGKSVLITGGSKGLGLASALALAGEGCDLHLAARSADALAVARDRILRMHSVQVTVHPIDLRERGSARRLAEAAGPVDILVNNAGAVPAGDLLGIDEARWREAWDLKLFGYINLAREIYGSMAARGRGVILNIIGTAGNLVPADYIVGVTGSAALKAFTRALGGVSLDRGVRVIGISPGDVVNERGIMFLRQQAGRELGDPERWRERLAGQPGGRGVLEEDIANAVLFLASDRAAYVSGEVLTVDGGLSARQRVL
jgi:NAD(P)-dependent dehydrogenase (short-subunit alcohol dehydrogenase family)